MPSGHGGWIAMLKRKMVTQENAILKDIFYGNVHFLPEEKKNAVTSTPTAVAVRSKQTQLLSSLF